jgi:hypothetical protein
MKTKFASKVILFKETLKFKDVINLSIQGKPHFPCNIFKEKGSVQFQSKHFAKVNRTKMDVNCKFSLPIHFFKKNLKLQSHVLLHIGYTTRV